MTKAKAAKNGGGCCVEEKTREIGVIHFATHLTMAVDSLHCLATYKNNYLPYAKDWSSFNAYFVSSYHAHT